MQDLKDILLVLLKSPTFIPLLATLLVTNQKWLFPQIPDEVVKAFLDFLVLVLLSISFYYTGGTMREKKYKRALVAKLLDKELEQ